MSYDCTIVDKEGEALQIQNVPRGGTYCVSEGFQEAWFNITFNYSKFIYRVLEGGIPGLHGKKVRDTIPQLLEAEGRLSGEPDPDYWAATEGNAKKALKGLLIIAVQAPDGYWQIDY